jgi:DNA uptake protein ComE-like DNA-binding protein
MTLPFLRLALTAIFLAAASLALNAQPKLKAGAGPRSKAAPLGKLVDINHATKDELNTLPGIQDPQADRIIAGRPYLTKARLVTRKVLSPELYEAIKKRIVAKQ